MKLSKIFNSNLDKLKKDFRETGDLLFNSNDPENPCVKIESLGYIHYKSLRENDIIWVKENSEYVKGKIIAQKWHTDIDNWKYKVETEKISEWRDMKDFQTYGKLCFTDVVPTKRVIDVCPMEL